MLAALLGALALGIFAFGFIEVVLLTFSGLKKLIKKKINNNPPGITEEAIIHIKSILDQAPKLSLEDFGPDIQLDDFLMVGIKDDGNFDENLDIIRAKQVDDDVIASMKKAGGAMKVMA